MEANGLLPCPSVSDSIPGAEDEVDVESISEIAQCPGVESECQHKYPLRRPRGQEQERSDREDSTTSAGSHDIVEATSGNSTDDSEPVLIQEWREVQQNRRKRRWTSDTDEQTHDAPDFRRLVLRINKLKVEVNCRVQKDNFVGLYRNHVLIA